MSLVALLYVAHKIHHTYHWAHTLVALQCSAWFPCPSALLHALVTGYFTIYIYVCVCMYAINV